MGRLVIYTVLDLEDKRGGVSIRLRVLSKSKTRSVRTRDGQEHSVVDAMAGDITGIVPLSLWDERIREVEEGDILDIENAYVNRFRGRLRLNIGKFGKLERVDDPSFPSAEELAKVRRRYFHRRRTGYTSRS